MIEITPENFIEYLQNPWQISKCYSAFHNYSTLNQWLASSQCLQIWPLNTFKWWEKLGRHVKKWERAIAMRMPITKTEKNDEGKDEVTSRFFVLKRNWFTVYQTDWKDFTPEIPGFDLSRIEEKLQVTRIQFNHADWNCQWFARQRSFAINPIAENPTKTMFHELAHILLWHTDRQIDDGTTLARDIKEFQAESVALICAATIGQTEKELSYSLGYLQHWGIPQELDKKMIEKLFSCASKIISACKA